MKYIFFDTETNGLPRNYRATYTEVGNWPRIVQLSWLLVDDLGTEKILSEQDYIIKVDFDIPPAASRIHGITNEISKEKGVELPQVLQHFLQDLEQADQMVCHNVAFDLPVVQCELLRSGLRHQIDLPQFCTMKNSTDYCKIPGQYGFKWPRLEELYFKCFGKNFENSHNAKADVRATFEVFYHLRKTYFSDHNISNSN